MMPSPINIATATRMEGAGSHRASTHPSRSFQPRRLLAVFGEAEPAEPPPRLRSFPPRLGGAASSASGKPRAATRTPALPLTLAGRGPASPYLF